jgi:uncharacterized RDD family membrane protein YckC
MNEDPRRGEPGLFDLPLDAPPPPAARPARDEVEARRRGAARPETLPLFTEEEIEGHLAERLERSEQRPEAPPPAAEPFRPRALSPVTPVAASRAGRRRAEPPAATPLARLRGAAGDLVVLAAVGALAALGAQALAAPIGPGQLPALALFLLAFSFVYFVVPLAFWGATPGMSWAGLVARLAPGEPISFGQSVLRWLAAWLTWGTLGLLGLVALSGRSLADRLSGSRTYRLDGSAVAA